MKRNELNTSFQDELPPEYAEKAAETVVKNAIDKEDALFLLDVLGLVPPQPGYEPNTKEKFARQQNNVTRRMRREEKRFQEQTERVKDGGPNS